MTKWGLLSESNKLYNINVGPVKFYLFLFFFKYEKYKLYSVKQLRGTHDGDQHEFPLFDFMYYVVSELIGNWVEISFILTLNWLGITDIM